MGGGGVIENNVYFEFAAIMQAIYTRKIVKQIYSYLAQIIEPTITTNQVLKMQSSRSTKTNIRF
jgi:hypothetical protein